MNPFRPPSASKSQALWDHQPLFVAVFFSLKFWVPTIGLQVLCWFQPESNRNKCKGFKGSPVKPLQGTSNSKVSNVFRCFSSTCEDFQKFSLPSWVFFVSVTNRFFKICQGSYVPMPHLQMAWSFEHCCRPASYAAPWGPAKISSDSSPRLGGCRPGWNSRNIQTKHTVKPWTLTWNPKMNVWRMIFPL